MSCKPGHQIISRMPVEELTGTGAGQRDIAAGEEALRTCRRWTLNGDFVTLASNGVARYARETVEALDTLVGEGHPLTRDLDLDLVAPRPYRLKHIPVRVVHEFRTPRLPQFWVQAQLPRHVPSGLVSFCNLAPVAVSRHIVCIHDLNTSLVPESYGLGFRLAHRIILPLLGRRAARITTVSGLSRDHIAGHGLASRDKIRVTYNGSDHAGRWHAGKALLKRPRQRNYALCIGRREKHKNTDLIYKIAEPLDRLDIDLYVVGDNCRGAAAKDSPARFPNISFLGRVSDDELAMLLSHALCLLFPSRVEGFGLPAVEAMVHGCPVVASTSPCLPEICSDAALYADPDDPNGWVSAVRDLQERPDLAATIRERGRVRAQLYSWRRVAEDYLELMAEIDAQSPMASEETMDARLGH